MEGLNVHSILGNNSYSETNTEKHRRNTHLNSIQQSNTLKHERIEYREAREVLLHSPVTS